MEPAVFENKLIHCWLPETGKLLDLVPGQRFPAFLTLPRPDVQTVIPLSLPKHSPPLNSSEAMHSHHFGPLPAGHHGPATKCQQMHDDHRHAGGQTSPYPVHGLPAVLPALVCPLLAWCRASLWHHFVLSQRISQHLSEGRKQKALMFWWSWSPDQEREAGQLLWQCGTRGQHHGESCVFAGEL